MRRWLPTVALGLGLWLLGPGEGLAGSAVVSAIFAGIHKGRLQLEIRGSEPLNYLVVENADPFSVSLLFLNATFGFPPEERHLPGPALTKIRTAVLERHGSRLGRLDLTFAKNTPYRVLKEGTRVLIRVDAPPPARPLLLRGSQRHAPLRAVTLSRPPAPAREAVPLILNLVAEVAGEDPRVVVEADGPLAYRSFALDKPDRVVVDFERARLTPARKTVEIEGTVLKRVRSAQFSPTVVRLVLDLARPTPFWIEARKEGVVIHLETPRPP